MFFYCGHSFPILQKQTGSEIGLAKTKQKQNLNGGSCTAKVGKDSLV